VKLYRLNIGQPDIVTPTPYYDALRRSIVPTLAYAPSPGVPDLALQMARYYQRLGPRIRRKTF
jgi:aspartate aminotransferase